jgi:hypothetical protein
MFKYATLAKFLSDTTVFQSSAEDVSNWLQFWYVDYSDNHKLFELVKGEGIH